MGKSTFSNRVITNWNNLPAALKFADNINLFKNLLDKDMKFKVQFRSFDKQFRKIIIACIANLFFLSVYLYEGTIKGLTAMYS